MKTRRLAQIDLDTGEILDGNVAWIPSNNRQHFKENWMVMFQEALEKIAKMNLSKDAHRVFMFMLSQMSFDNYALISQAHMSEILLIDKGNLSRAIKELKKQNILVTSDKTPGKSLAYRINSHYAWKGTPKQFAKVRAIDPR